MQEKKIIAVTVLHSNIGRYTILYMVYWNMQIIN